MPSRYTKKSTLIVAAALMVAPLGALFAEGSDIYKVRHDGYHDLGDAFKTLRDEVRESSPNAAKIKTATAVVADVAVKQYDWFPAGSGPKPGVKTRAKAEIWSKPSEFAAAQKLFADAAAKLNKAATAGDIAAVKAQFGDVGKTCKNCHDNFRTPED